ncbi:MAG: hypothetical protein CFE30_01130 [Bradyrhizobium sp. PARBB1]|jgi:hypothetical protein|nr:MAG: hypothetical protein CFE30_01130 [Bradyrhizobium sp. PARBB1]PSO25761.1 hypothetical protein C7G43_14875 [Bradyrhizobium sp. MOS004]HAR17411.1 hypothetical protein [Bradyrhizobium sp.]HAR29397.1 hypothetical protein [Bradyrhizobium sp.]HBY31118.1 hypothetical protein [Bradyrhizobium sp.]
MWVIENLVGLFLSFVVDVIGYTAARLILPAVSLGHIQSRRTAVTKKSSVGLAAGVTALDG